MDWKGAIGKVAPWLAATLGGPAAGVGVDVLCKALGMEPSPENAKKIAEQAAAGSLTGEQYLALKKAESDCELRMKELDYASLKDLESLAVDDRKDARNREIQLRDRMPAVLAVIVTLGFFGLLFYLMKWAPPESNKDVLNIMLGSLGTAWISVVSYYFGSSSGSSRKDELLHKSTPVEGAK